MSTEFISGRKSNKTSPSLSIELQDTLVLTRKRQSNGDRKGFEEACRDQAIMKATKKKANRNKKLNIAEAELMEASYLYQHYQHSA